MNQAPTPDQAKPERGGLLRSLLWFALIAWVLRSLIVAPFSIPSGSMLPTMQIGDYLFVAKWPYGYSRYSFPLSIPSFDGRVMGHLPQRGDIVVFRPPGREDQDWVKRVIGLPGDSVGVVRGQLVLNGKPVPRVAAGSASIGVSPNSPCRGAYGAPGATQPLPGGGANCLYPAFRETLPGGPSYLTLDQADLPRADDFPAVTVPAGSLFLMGDNRDDSLDSRFQPFEGGIGLVPLDHLVGRATYRFWSTDGSASWLNPLSWFTALRGSRVGGSYNP